MTLYPEAQRQAQDEIDKVVGNTRLPDFSDEAALPYVQAVLKEVLRWHPVAPLCGCFYVAGIMSLVTRMFLQPCHTGSHTAISTKDITFLPAQLLSPTCGALFVSMLSLCEPTSVIVIGE
jgi:Cytochrome P450